MRYYALNQGKHSDKLNFITQITTNFDYVRRFKMKCAISPTNFQKIGIAAKNSLPAFANSSTRRQACCLLFNSLLFTYQDLYFKLGKEKKEIIKKDGGTQIEATQKTISLVCGKYNLHYKIYKTEGIGELLKDFSFNDTRMSWSD